MQLRGEEVTPVPNRDYLKYGRLAVGVIFYYALANFLTAFAYLINCFNIERSRCICIYATGFPKKNAEKHLQFILIQCRNFKSKLIFVINKNEKLVLNVLKIIKKIRKFIDNLSDIKLDAS